MSQLRKSSLTPSQGRTRVVTSQARDPQTFRRPGMPLADECAILSARFRLSRLLLKLLERRIALRRASDIFKSLSPDEGSPTTEAGELGVQHPFEQVALSGGWRSDPSPPRDATTPTLRRDIRVIERGERLRLTSESRKPIGVACERLRQHVDGD
jgi:hypothetical protein